MRGTGLVVLTSLAACGSIWLLAGWSMQPRPSLSRTIRRIRRRPPASVSHAGAALRLGALLLGDNGDPHPAAPRGPIIGLAQRWRAPLRLVDRTVAQHVGILVSAALVGFVAPATALALLQVAGMIAAVWWMPAGVGLLAAALAPLLVHSVTISRAAEHRVDLRHQLSAYLDMVTMLLAGNVGHEGALDAAARGGDGQLFRELRRRMREATTRGDSLVTALAAVGADFDLVELEQVAATTALSAAEGAPVGRTLRATCGTLRSSLAAEQEAASRIRTDKVTPPLVGMAVLFMALIIYPALTLS